MWGCVVYRCLTIDNSFMELIYLLIVFQELWEKLWKCEEAGSVPAGSVVCPFTATGRSLGLDCLFLHFHLSALEQAMKSAALGLLCLLKAKDSLPFVI